MLEDSKQKERGEPCSLDFTCHSTAYSYAYDRVCIIVANSTREFIALCALASDLYLV